MARHGTGMSSPFDEAFAGDKGRRTKYTQWSERAVVVGFNRKINAYDIIVTTEKSTGNDKRSLNRTIRQVKSLASTSEVLFSPGDSILVGYVADQREHPIILGQGDNFVQTPLKTTLPNTVIGAGSSSEGGSEEGLNPSGQNFQNACPFKLEDLSTGSTITFSADCPTLDIDGCFTNTLIAKCACGGVSWSVVGGTDAFPGFEISLEEFGPNDTRLKICPPVNNPSVSGVAYEIKAHVITNEITCSSGSQRTYTFGCNNKPTSLANLNQLGSSCGGIEPSCKGSNAQCGEQEFDPEICCGSAFFRSCPEGCFPTPCTIGGLGPVTSAMACLILRGNRNLGGNNINDTRTQGMIDAGCNPCGFIHNAIITAEDGCGQMVSVEIKDVTPEDSECRNEPFSGNLDETCNDP